MSLPWPEPTHGDYILKDFNFFAGGSLPELRIHYQTIGTLKKDSNSRATNAVLILHNTTGSGAVFLRPIFAGKLFNRGQLLSGEDYFLILPDSIGHGKSTKPSDGLRARFPRYCYGDMVRAQYLLLTEHLDVNHLRLVMGASMGGMHTWVWATTYFDFMDAAMPLASLPTQIAGRNRMTRKHIIESIRTDPEFKDGNYTTKNLKGFTAALHVLAWMSSSPLKWQEAAPDRESADDFIDAMIEFMASSNDPNDFAYAFDASWDYDPRPGLEKIQAFLTAVNSADDQVNPPELRILEEEIKTVKHGKAVVLPITDKTTGHATHTVAETYMEYLKELLEKSKESYSSSKI